jgi:DNA-binding MarR family transcriptional regulator
MNLEQEINQSVFKDNFHKAHVNLLFTAAWLNHKVNRLLKPYDISGQQFNILRILKGMGCKPSSLKVITSRMLDKTSNTSRLVDKLIDKNLVNRTFCPNDRRQVEIRITEEGLQLLHICNEVIEIIPLVDFNLFFFTGTRFARCLGKRFGYSYSIHDYC